MLFVGNRVDVSETIIAIVGNKGIKLKGCTVEYIYATAGIKLQDNATINRKIKILDSKNTRPGIYGPDDIYNGEIKYIDDKGDTSSVFKLIRPRDKN